MTCCLKGAARRQQTLQPAFQQVAPAHQGSSQLLPSPTLVWHSSPIQEWLAGQTLQSFQNSYQCLGTQAVHSPQGGRGPISPGATASVPDQDTNSCLTKTQTRVAWHDSLPCLQAEHMLRQGRLQDADQLMAVRTSALPFVSGPTWQTLHGLLTGTTSTEPLSQYVPGGWACSAGSAVCTFQLPSSCRRCNKGLQRPCLAGSAVYACTHCCSSLLSLLAGSPTGPCTCR